MKNTIFRARIAIVHILRMNKGRMEARELDTKLREHMESRDMPLPKKLHICTVLKLMIKDDVITFNKETYIVRLKHNLKPLKRSDAPCTDDMGIG